MQDEIGVNTFVNEAISFQSRNKDLSEFHSAVGATLFGFMKALSECPECPGHFRIPYDTDGTPNAFGEWKYLYCPHCKNMWGHQPENSDLPLFQTP